MNKYRLSHKYDMQKKGEKLAVYHYVPVGFIGSKITDLALIPNPPVDTKINAFSPEGIPILLVCIGSNEFRELTAEEKNASHT